MSGRERVRGDGWELTWMGGKERVRGGGGNEWEGMSGKGWVERDGWEGMDGRGWMGGTGGGKGGGEGNGCEEKGGRG